MIHSENIICISSIDWEFVWQGHQEIMSTFSKQGNRVLFIENTGVRTPSPRDLPRLKRRLVNWSKGLKGFRNVQERLWVYSPVILPFPYSRMIRWVNRWLLLTAIKRWMKAMGFHDPILWTFLPTGVALDVVTHLDHKLAIYYCIADFEQLVSNPKKVRRTEQAVIERCDLVFAQGKALEEKCRRWNPHVHVFPFGVKLEAFERDGDASRDVPDDMRQIPRPIIGYIGGLHRHVDFKLLEFIVQQRREWSLALVGPIQTDVSAINGSRNVFFLGQKPFSQLPQYINTFDVAIVPYVQSEYTKTVYPTKLNEYHALGKPVVSTSLPEVMAFNKQYGPLIHVAKDYEQFLDHLDHVLQHDDVGLIDRRMAVAREHAWDRRIEEMSRLIAERIQQKSATAPGMWKERFVAMYRRARRQTVVTFALLAAAYLLVFYSPLVWWAAAPLNIAEPPVPSDAIVVVAGGVGESGKAGQGYEERVAWAVELYQKGYAGKLVFSSGYTYKFREPEVMKALAVALGVPAGDVWLEDQATNTFQHVSYVNRLLDQQGWETVLFVSSPYHMRRVSLVWRALAPRRRVTYVPIPTSRFYSHGRDARGRRTWRQASVRQIGSILHEYVGIVYYWWKGWI
jgi:uncharacterized SAM-binding protein YcdF (DUF218 family)